MRPKYRCTIKKPGKVGEPSSKYGYPGGGEQFEKDIQAKAEAADVLYAAFVEWMREHNADPETVRAMFVRFYFDMKI